MGNQNNTGFFAKNEEAGVSLEFFSIFFIAVGLAMDAFAVSVSNGVSVRGFGVKESALQGFYFGVFQFLMPVIGYLLGSTVQAYIEAVDHWIAFGLLAAIGINMIRESRGEEEKVNCVLTPKVLLVQAIATSIDALAVGMSFALLKVDIFFAAGVIGVVAFVISFIGGTLGKKLGDMLQSKAELAGGLILICTGLKILVEHLFL